MRLHDSILSGQDFNRLRKCTSAGQIFVRYRVNVNRVGYLHRRVSVSCLKLCNTSYNAMIVVFVGTALCKYEQKGENNESLNRRVVSLPVYKNVVHVYGKQSRNDIRLIEC